VLKDGQWQGTYPVAQVTPDELVRRMVGRELLAERLDPEPWPSDRPVVLEVRGLRDGPSAAGGRPLLKGINLSVRAGEVLALAGLVGAGRTELALALMGARPGVSGEVLRDGRRLRIRNPADAVAAGIGYLPEDRKEAGLFLPMSVTWNMAAVALGRFGSWWLRDGEQAVAAREYCQTLRVAHRDVREPVRNLSGGNQQKVVLAKWLLRGPKVLIVDEPTRGVDVGAKAEVHALLRGLARGGTAVVVISSDLPEVLALADRIVVMRAGAVTGELTRAEATEEAVMRYASLAAVRTSA
jgi:L-arabinose transport system ATP-binding protein